MPKDVPQNLKRVEESLTGNEIKALNDLSTGLGHKLHRLFSSLGSSVAAQSGHKGGVGIVKQKAKDTKGVVEAALTLQEDRVAGLADPIEDLDAVNLRTLRRMLPDATETGSTEGDALKEVCRPTTLSNMKTAATEMTEIYVVEVLNEFVYVLGADGFVGVLEVYVLLGENAMFRVGRLELSEIPTRMVLQGHYLYACNVNGGSQNLTVIDVKQPDTPVEVVVFDVGATAANVHAQGRFVYVACAGSCKIVDVSVPGLPIVRGTTP